MKPLAILLSVGLILSGILRAAEEKVETAYIKGERINIRARAKGDAEICCQLSKGDSVEILERKFTSTVGTNTEEWVRIVLPEKATVWVEAGLLVNNSVQKRTNGRAGPGLNWPVLGLFQKGEVLNVRTNLNEWTGVAPTRATSAWISGRFLQNDPIAVPAMPVAKP